MADESLPPRDILLSLRTIRLHFRVFDTGIRFQIFCRSFAAAGIGDTGEVSRRMVWEEDRSVWQIKAILVCVFSIFFLDGNLNINDCLDAAD